MNESPYKNFGWLLDDIAGSRAGEGLIDLSEAVHRHTLITEPTCVTSRLWTALGGGVPDPNESRVKVLCWKASFALGGLAKVSEEFRPFARIVQFWIGLSDSIVPRPMQVAAVVFRPISGPRQVILMLSEEL
jgi:hypothetical protein